MKIVAERWRRWVLISTGCLMFMAVSTGSLKGAQADDRSGGMLCPQKITADSSGYEYEGAHGGSPVCLGDGIRTAHYWRESWASRDKAEPHWVELIFGEPAPVKSVAIHWNIEQGMPCSSMQYRIQVWEKGAWKDVLDVKNNPPGALSVHSLDVPPTERLRIWQPAGGGPRVRPNAMWISEVEAYDYTKPAKEFGSKTDLEQLSRHRIQERDRTTGVYMRGRLRGRAGAVARPFLRSERRIVELDSLNERELRRCGTVIIAGVRHIPNRDKLMNFIYNGGGVLFVYDACGRSGGSMLPEIWEFKGMGTGELSPTDEIHPVTGGVTNRFRTTYGDHARLKRGKKGKALVKDTDGHCVVIAGCMGEGKAIAMGNFPGLSSGTNWSECKMVTSQSDELMLLINSINWLADGTCLQDEWKESPEAKAWRKNHKAGEIQFSDVTEDCGMTHYWYSKCVAMADVNEDDRLDIFATMMKLPTSDKTHNLLYMNEGGWQFKESALNAGIGSPPGIGSVFGDINGDGHVDLFVCWLPEMGGQGRGTLYLGDGKGKFRDVTDAGGLAKTGKTALCMLSDIDHDGDLDLYLVGFASENRLYRNRGDARFEDVTEPLGLAGLGSKDEKGYGGNLAAGMADLDGDGWQDLVCFSKGALRVLKNREGKKFDNVTEYMGKGKPPIPGSALGLTMGDMDNDGDLDLYASGVNRLLRNDGNMRFTDVTTASGLEDMEKNIHPYCPIFVDYDNDGNQDLFLGTGGFDSFAYHNNGDGSFSDVTGTIGLDAYGVHGCNFGDLDNDGDLDFYSTAWSKHPCRLLCNNQDDKNYLVVKIKGRKPNTSGIGAKVWIYGEAKKDGKRVLKGYSEVRGGGGGMYTCPGLEQHFGLPDGGKYSVEVLFPVSGKRVTLENVAAGRSVVVQEPE